MSTEELPKGIVGILIDDTGYVRATATDFDKGGAAGFTDWQKQKLRVRQRMAWNFIKDHMMQDLADAINGHYNNAEDIVNRLVRDKKWRTHYVAVGYEGVDPNE